jgi:hypothetical protein
MNNRLSISLLFATCTLITSLAFAESPAVDDIENTDIEPVFIDTDDVRPVDENLANDEAIDEPENLESLPVSETVETGTVLNNTDEPILVRKLDFPRRGMTEDKVKNELGNPGEIKPAVGKPPISQWVYDDRIVYFEFATVLHVVAK